MSETPLFERLGGKPAVEAAVDKFYDRVLEDDRIKHFFDGIDMSKQRGHQKAFLTHAFGGSSNYDGRSMREAHRRLVEKLGMTDKHFDAVIDDLGAALRDLGVAEDLVQEVAAIAESVRGDVLNRSAV